MQPNHKLSPTEFETISSYLFEHGNIPPNFFEYKEFQKEKNLRVYELNVKKLPSQDCHMFFPVKENLELLVTTQLEFITFHPTTPLNEKFNLKIVCCDSIELYWCSFPIEFKDVCKRAGERYEMVVSQKSREFLGGGEDSPFHTFLRLPFAENVMNFVSKNIKSRENYERNFQQESLAIIQLGNSLERYSID